MKADGYVKSGQYCSQALYILYTDYKHLHNPSRQKLLYFLKRSEI